MDFSNVNINDILFSAIPKKFQDFNPFDFEDFISQLFRDMGFMYVEKTKSTGDFGADILIKKEIDEENSVGISVVQVKRYNNKNVGVPELNQVIGAKEYYKADNMICITTSDYTRQAKKLAEEAQIELWDWDELLEQISDVYWDSLDYYSYFQDKLEKTSDNFEEANNRSEIIKNFEFSLQKVDYTLVTADKHNKP